MGSLFSKDLSGEEKAKLGLQIPVEALSALTLEDHFKLKFPFYIMDIEVFEFKLNKIVTDNKAVN